MARWRKLGRAFCLPTSDERSTTHAQVPTVLLKPDVVRIYFAARNLQGRSYPAYVDVARADLTRVVAVQDQPVMPYGKPGAFDDEGIMPACIVERNEGIWMYYSGWNRRVSVPYHNSTGLALSVDGGNSFQRKFDGPLFDRTPEEPYLAVTPSVMCENDAWRAWYISGLGWEKIAGKFEPVYVIKAAHSADGIHWMRPNIQ